MSQSLNLCEPNQGVTPGPTLGARDIVLGVDGPHPTSPQIGSVV